MIECHHVEHANGSQNASSKREKTSIENTDNRTAQRVSVRKTKRIDDVERKEN